ncbi:MAG TPA: polysaccharide biosynthesis/export family protein [Dongiaceae bacterium]
MNQAFVTIVAVLLFGLAGCAAKVPMNTVSQFDAEYQRAKSTGYQIHPGDQLDITFFYTPEYNATAVPVRPDGKIQLPLVGEFPIAGMTPQQASDSLKQQYTKVLKNPDLAVVVKGFGANSVVVQGEVRQPQAVPLAGDETLLQIIGRAGGFDGQADMSKVTVVRHATAGTPLKVTLDLRKALRGLDTSVDIPVMAGDVVYVPLLTGRQSDVTIQDIFGGGETSPTSRAAE